MKPETLQALKGSIAKWEAIVAGTGADLHDENCALCARFNNEDTVKACEHDGEACPVYARSGVRFCVDTPFVDAWCRETGGEYRAVASTPERKAAAQAELDFLKSLLPDEAES